VRGTPQQVIEKYQGLARDAQVSGDRVAAENYLQHAEHYARLLGEAQRQTHEARQEREDRDGQRDEDQREHAPREPVARDQREGQRDDQRDDQRGARAMISAMTGATMATSGRAAAIRRGSPSRPA
jgi:hypothetical protein